MLLLLLLLLLLLAAALAAECLPFDLDVATNICGKGVAGVVLKKVRSDGTDSCGRVIAESRVVMPD